MLQNSPVTPTLPVDDLARAKKFYQEKLGLETIDESDDAVKFACGGGSTVTVYKPSNHKVTHNTSANWKVDSIDQMVTELKTKGVSFEDYDEPDFKTENSIVRTSPKTRCAWFKDSEGNTLGLTEYNN